MQHPKYLTTTSLKFGFKRQNIQEGLGVAGLLPPDSRLLSESFNSEFSGLMGSIGVTTARKMQFLKREYIFMVENRKILDSLDK